jgi:hypothetical protein
MNTSLTLNVTVRKNKWWWVKLKAMLLLGKFNVINKQCVVDWANNTSEHWAKYRLGNNDAWRWLIKPNWYLNQSGSIKIRGHKNGGGIIHGKNIDIIHNVRTN